MIDRLEVKGLIGRVRDVADRRKVLVAMTPRGRERTGQLYGPMVIEGNKILARFSDDELALLRDFLVATRELTDRHRARLRK
jgi:DNA-binding MarR family transcriptional regulator